MQHDTTTPETPETVEDVKAEDGEEALFDEGAAGGSEAPAKKTPARKRASKVTKGAAKATKTTTGNSSTKDESQADTADGVSGKLEAGDELEIRLARMQFFRGAYTRRGVNLERHFHPEPLLVTDLDLFSVELTARLTMSKTIGEAKSGTGRSAPKPLDRAIWVAGLKQLVGADGGVVLTALKPSAKVRDTVRSLGVTAMTVDDLTRWETTHLPAALEDVGTHGPTAFAADAVARRTVKGEPVLERIYWFLRSEVWFLDAWQATKRLLGAISELRRFWTPEIEDGQAAALRWMYAEALSILTLQLVVLVGRFQASEASEWSGVARDRLAEGPIPAGNQRALASAFDKYLAKILGELKAPATMHVETMGAFHPTPPEWADGLIELLARLEALPGLDELPRQTDLVLAERLVRRRHASAEALAAVSSRDPEEFAKMRRQIAAFLRGALELPEAVDKALTA